MKKFLEGVLALTLGLNKSESQKGMEDDRNTNIEYTALPSKLNTQELIL